MNYDFFIIKQKPKGLWFALTGSLHNSWQQGSA
ncbi:MAG: hypothetical protein PWP11_525 [Thauera sp.]|jgi:hypothetical protein|nr:hypothetical protein [Thauera sp.]